MYKDADIKIVQRYMYTPQEKNPTITHREKWIFTKMLKIIKQQLLLNCYICIFLALECVKNISFLCSNFTVLISYVVEMLHFKIFLSLLSTLTSNLSYVSVC